MPSQRPLPNRTHNNGPLVLMRIRITMYMIFLMVSAWAKKADVDTEGALLAALDTKEEIPIIPYSSLFILSSENK